MQDFRSRREAPDSSPDETATNKAASAPAPNIEYSNGDNSVEATSDAASSGVTSNDTTSGSDDISAMALNEASEMLSQQIIGETPLVPPKVPLRRRIAGSVTRHHGLLLALCVLLLWGAMTLRWPGASGHLQVGERAIQDIIAPRATTLLDREASQERRDEAAALVTPEYDSDLNAQNKALSSLNILLRLTKQNARVWQTQRANFPNLLLPKSSTRNALPSANGRAPATSISPQNALVNARLAAIRRLNRALRSRGLKPLATSATAVLEVAPTRWRLMESVARDGVRAAYFDGGRVQQIRSDADDDLSLAFRRIANRVNLAAKNAAKNNSSTRLAPLSSLEKSAAIALATNAARVPNLVVNTRKTERARNEARAGVPSVYRNIVAGSVLVEAGSVVDRDHWAQLQDLDLVAPRLDASTTIARLLLCALVVGFAAVYLSRSSPEIVRAPSALWLLALTPPILVAIARVLLRVPFGEALLTPLIAVGAMMLTILLNARAGLLCGLAVSLLCAVMARSDSTSFASITLGAAVGVLAVSEIATRAHLVRATFILGIVSAVLAVVAGILRETAWSEMGSIAIFAGGSGAVAVGLAAGFAMFLERPLGITTHLSLLELSSPDEPVMRRMQSEAPGTYTHSLMVAQLSEAAAKAVFADALLCRVAGLYHDVGKLRRPHCFIENQSGVNVHDRLTPQLSALLIIAHVKDGLELARALRLPRPIHDIIQQHHGTDLVSYFWNRAQQAANIGLGSAPDETTFRYSGPRPQSKESAIVMLADAVEASSRALPELTPEKLQTHIQSMIALRLQEGQLAQCELTMRDLTTIEAAFAHVLRGALHQRIEYPDPSRDWKNETQANWTRQAMRDPQRDAQRDADRQENAPRRITRQRNAAQSENDAKSSEIESARDETSASPNGSSNAANANAIRNARLASFAAHFRRARSSPNANANNSEDESSTRLRHEAAGNDETQNKETAENEAKIQTNHVETPKVLTQNGAAHDDEKRKRAAQNSTMQNGSNGNGSNGNGSNGNSAKHDENTEALARNGAVFSSAKRDSKTQNSEKTSDDANR